MPGGVNRSGDVSIWEVPEIDGVRRSLEHGTWDDDSSDKWWKLIDLATDPKPMTGLRVERIVRLMWHFAREADYIQTTLAHGAETFNTPDLVQHYQNALEQIAMQAGVDIPEAVTV